ncbi:sensor domain-containing diguanylate cyclase [Reinekea marinisedimentorum]|uniref:PAS domain S-box-containing protein/diguanylate cyclase (GGDEF)-like protein n=1 Tax=Reinekea marinisedimentorum TaxID=230495 RepID=A0A4R3I749_9GAMM|nr:sensor domain-containing diguanylate cyclase [Reinekea marinisedimentorum]TCS40694.1 PAS domain S-box-containing protein/diguanylate cyclase (GGDEF)-like protein [Reinekea marinisedimentorum]
MFSKWKDTLVLRVVASIIIYSFVLTLGATVFFYQNTYSREINRQTSRIDQLALTVENSAAIAAYLSNRELALEVLNGLVKNDIVDVAIITGEQGFEESIHQHDTAATAPPIHYELPSPFMQGELAGRLSITPNQQLIENSARNAAALHALILLAYAITIISLVASLIHSLLTKPLTNMKNAVMAAKPGYDKELTYIPQNPNNEIGQLVQNSNELLTSIHDTLQREKQLSRKIVSVERRYRLLFEQSGVGIALITQAGRIDLCNSTFAKFTARCDTRDRDDTTSITFAEMFVKQQEMTETLRSVSAGNKIISGDFKFRGHDQSQQHWFHCLFSLAMETNGQPLIEVVMYDISERAMREKQYRFEAEYDSLTMLYNRRATERRISAALDDAKTQGRQCALIVIDLDHFKPVNDKYGHDAGDIVLIESAKRLRESVRRGDIVCRWGGDEFLIVLRQGREDLKVEPAARAILDALTQPIDIGRSRSVSIGASLGVACTPEHGIEKSELLKKADDAMYLIKQNGRNGYCVSGQQPHYIER